MVEGVEEGLEVESEEIYIGSGRAVVMCVMTVVVYVWRRRVSRGGREGGESDWGDWLCWLRSVVRRPE